MNTQSPETRIVEALTPLVAPIVADYGMELVEVQFRREQAGYVLRIIIYRLGGINVDDCALVSREVSHLLDVEDLIPQHYHLEVSSPGLDRPLRTESDFLRHRGQEVRIVCKDIPEPLQGIIGDCGNEEVVLESEGKRFDVALHAIVKAKLVLHF